MAAAAAVAVAVAAAGELGTDAGAEKEAQFEDNAPPLMPPVAQHGPAASSPQPASAEFTMELEPLHWPPSAPLKSNFVHEHGGSVAIGFKSSPL
jgi:hypothetical protein